MKGSIVWSDFYPRCVPKCDWFPLFSNYVRSMITIRNFLLHYASQSMINTVHCLPRIRFARVLQKIQYTFDDKFHFCGIYIVMFKLDSHSINTWFQLWLVLTVRKLDFCLQKRNHFFILNRNKAIFEHFIKTTFLKDVF